MNNALIITHKPSKYQETKFIVTPNPSTIPDDKTQDYQFKTIIGDWEEITKGKDYNKINVRDTIHYGLYMPYIPYWKWTTEIISYEENADELTEIEIEWRWE